MSLGSETDPQGPAKSLCFRELSRMPLDSHCSQTRKRGDQVSVQNGMQILVAEASVDDAQRLVEALEIFSRPAAFQAV